MTNKVLLIAPPIASVLRPFIGISSLKSVLENNGIDVENVYLNIDYAETIGVELNEYLSEQMPAPFLVGEWIFSGLLRQITLHEEEKYYQFLRKYFSIEQIVNIQAIKKQSANFISYAATKLVAKKPTLIGFSTSFQQNCSSLAIAAKIRELDPQIVICFGGANCEGEMGEALVEQFSQIDYVFSGESEETFLDFVKSFISKNTNRLDRNYIKGKAIENLDLLPMPDYSDYFRTIQQASFFHRVNTAILFETSRGCWWGYRNHCTFCGLNGNSIRFRKKSPKKIAAEIDMLFKEWKVPRFMVVDNIMDASNILKAFNLLEESEKIHFFWEVRVNLSKPKLLELQKHGVVWMQPGIESLSNSILKIINKGTTCLENIYFLKTCGELGISASWNILAGFPEEEIHEYKNMTDLLPKLEHLEPPNGCSAFVICRFSPYYERQKEYHLHHVQPYETYQQVYGFSEEATRRIAYFFINKPPVEITQDYLIPVKEAISGWKEYWQKARPILTLHRTENGGDIIDTRTNSVKNKCTLNTIEVDILAFFQSPRKIKDGENFYCLTISPEVYQKLVNGLIQNAYIIESDEYALSLVMENPAPFISTDKQSPILGWLDQG